MTACDLSENNRDCPQCRALCAKIRRDDTLPPPPQPFNLIHTHPNNNQPDPYTLHVSYNHIMIGAGRTAMVAHETNFDTTTPLSGAVRTILNIARDIGPSGFKPVCIGCHGRGLASACTTCAKLICTDCLVKYAYDGYETGADGAAYKKTRCPGCRQDCYILEELWREHTSIPLQAGSSYVFADRV